MIVRDLRPPAMQQYETVWVFETVCTDDGPHTITDLTPPIRCSRCGAETVERERKLPG